VILKPSEVRPGQRTLALLGKGGEELGGRHHADRTVENIILAFHVDLEKKGDAHPLSEIPQ